MSHLPAPRPANPRRPARLVLEAGIVVLWLAITGSLVVRETGLFDPPAAPAPLYASLLGSPGRASTDDETYSVTLGDRPVGRLARHADVRADGSATLETRIELAPLGRAAVGNLRATVTVEVDAARNLASLEATVRSDLGRFEVDGAPTGHELVISTYRLLDDGQRQRLSSEGIPFDPSAMLATGLSPTQGLRPAPGRRWRIPTWNPLSRSAEEVLVTVQGLERVPDAGGTLGWRLRITGSGFGDAVAWLDDDGALLRQEGPLLLVLVRQPDPDAPRGQEEQTR